MTHHQNSFYFKLLFWFSMYLHCIISEWPSKKGWLASMSGGSPPFYSLDRNILIPFQTVGLGDVWVGFLRHSPTDGNQLPQAAESILRAGSLWASHSGKSLAARAGKAGERIRRVEVKQIKTKLVWYWHWSLNWLKKRLTIVSCFDYISVKFILTG